MKRKSDSTQPKPRRTKRQKEVYDTDGQDAPAKQTANRLSFQDADSIREQARPYRLATAKLPIGAIHSTWSIGQNRRLNLQHARNLCGIFRQGGLNRKAEANHVLVLCSSTQVSRMLDHLKGQNKLDDADGVMASEVLFFADWLSVNDGQKVELMAGQHRIKALELYLQQTGSGNEEAWWTCEFYDRGM